LQFSEKMFDREVDPLVENSLSVFINQFKISGLDFETSVMFSEFISLSAKQSYKNRYSVSKLSQIFNSNQLPTSELLKIYMIALLCLQKEQGKEFVW
jgi:hypothetical protein